MQMGLIGSGFTLVWIAKARGWQPLVCWWKHTAKWRCQGIHDLHWLAGEDPKDCQFWGGETGNMAHLAEIGYFSSEGSITPDLDKEINANFFWQWLRYLIESSEGSSSSLPLYFQLDLLMVLHELLLKINASCWTTDSGWNGRASQKLMHGHWMQLISAQESRHLKRKVSIYFIGFLLYLEILNAQSGCPATVYHLTYFFQKIFWMDTGTPSTDFPSSTFGSNFLTQVLASFMSAHTVFIIWVKAAQTTLYFHFEELFCSGICLSVHFTAELQDNYG